MNSLKLTTVFKSGSNLLFKKYAKSSLEVGSKEEKLLINQGFTSDFTVTYRPRVCACAHAN